MNKRYSEEERQRHLSACEKSGLSILEYSKRNNLSLGIISFWRRRQQRLNVGKFEEVILPGALSGALTINLYSFCIKHISDKLGVWLDACN
jgi:hypothetical protein